MERACVDNHHLVWPITAHPLAYTDYREWNVARKYLRALGNYVFVSPFLAGIFWVDWVELENEALDCTARRCAAFRTNPIEVRVVHRRDDASDLVWELECERHCSRLVSQTFTYGQSKNGCDERTRVTQEKATLFRQI